jgi:hypothetical protein
MATNQFDKALALIQELNETSENRSQRIIQKSDSICRKFQNAEITNLEQLIEKNPQESLIISA